MAQHKLAHRPISSNSITYQSMSSFPESSPSSSPDSIAILQGQEQQQKSHRFDSLPAHLRPFHSLSGEHIGSISAVEIVSDIDSFHAPIPTFLLSLIPAQVPPILVEFAWKAFRGDGYLLLRFCHSLNAGDLAALLTPPAPQQTPKERRHTRKKINPNQGKKKKKKTQVAAQPPIAPSTEPCLLSSDDSISPRLTCSPQPFEPLIESFLTNADASVAPPTPPPEADTSAQVVREVVTILDGHFNSLIDLFGDQGALEEFYEWAERFAGVLRHLLEGHLDETVAIYFDTKDATGFKVNGSKHYDPDGALLALDWGIDNMEESIPSNPPKRFDVAIDRSGAVGLVIQNIEEELGFQFYDQVSDVANTLGLVGHHDSSQATREEAAILYDAVFTMYPELVSMRSQKVNQESLQLESLPIFPERISLNPSLRRRTDRRELVHSADDIQSPDDVPMIKNYTLGRWPPQIARHMRPEGRFTILPTCSVLHRVIRVPDFQSINNATHVIHHCRASNSLYSSDLVSRMRICRDAEYAKVYERDIAGLGVLPPKGNAPHVRGHRDCRRITIDLHYCTQDIARSAVQAWVDWLKQPEHSTAQISFVTGIGRGTASGKRSQVPPVLAAVLKELSLLPSRYLWKWDQFKQGVVLLCYEQKLGPMNRR